jgi:LysR family transcriptional regulator, regulator for bpeEF and oprC
MTDLRRSTSAPNFASSNNRNRQAKLRDSDVMGSLWPFVLAAQNQSLTRAATLLKITPSAVSRAITKLENDLGVRLLERSPRRVRLTAEGEPFFRVCEKALESIEAAKQTTVGSSADVQGLLKLSLPVSLGEIVVVPALATLLATFPKLEIETVLTDVNVDLEQGGFDAVLRLGRRLPSALKARELPSVRWVTVAAPKYLHQFGEPKTPSQLEQHNCLRYVLSKGTPQPWHFKSNSRPIAPAVRGSYLSNHPGTLVQLATAGVGVLQAHEYLLTDAIQRGAVKVILNDYEPPSIPLGIVFLASKSKLPRFRAFAAAMVELFKAP